MKTLFKILFFLLCFQFAKSQTGPPLVKSTLRVVYGYVQADSGMIVARRDTAWTPLLPGTLVFWLHNGVDTALWQYTGAVSGVRWQKVGIGTGVGSVTTLTATDANGFTWTITNPTTTPNLSLSLQNAAADGTTKGQATFAAGDFNSVSGLISLDYANMQVASGSQPGILSTTLYTVFNGKENPLTFNSPLVRTANSVSINNGAADGVNKGAMAGVAADFNATNGIFSLDYVNGQKASATQPGFLSSTDWVSFSLLDSLVVTNAGVDGFGIIYTNTTGDTLFGKKIRAGANVSIVQEADSSLTISSTGAGSGGYATILEDGSSLTQRNTFNFIGPNVTAADNAGATRTDITFAAASQSSAGYVALATQKLGTGTKIVDTLSVNEASYPINTMLYVKGTAGSTAPVYFKTTGTADNFVRIESDSRAWVVGAGGSGGGVALSGSFVVRDLSAPGTRMSINTTGDLTVNDWAGSGNRLVFANAAGLSGTAVIGTGLAFDGTTLTSTGSGDVISDLGSTTNGYIAVANGTTAKHITFVSQVPNANIVSFNPFPAQSTFQTIYEKSSWTNLSDFLTQGTATVALNSGFVDITSGTEDYTPRVIVLPGRPTGLTKFKITARYKITVWTATSNWFGPILKSLVTHDGANFGYMGFSSVASSGSGAGFLYDETGTTLLTNGTGPTKSLNDVMEVTFERNNTTLTYTIRNVTTSSSTQTLTYTWTSGTPPLPNVGNWGFMTNGTGGTIQLQYLKIESGETLNPNGLIIGDSKSIIFATSFASRPFVQLNALYPDFLVSAGSAERITDQLLKIDELTQYNPEYVLLAAPGENDIRAGTSLTLVMQYIDVLFRRLNGGGATKVYIFTMPEDSTAGGANLTAYRNAIAGAYPSNYIAGVWDGLRVGVSDNRLAAAYNFGDGVHLNQAGYNQVVATLIASGLLATISINRRSEIATTDGLVKKDGDRLSFGIPWQKVANNVPYMNSSYQMEGGPLWWNGSTNAIISASINPTAPSGAILFNVNGAQSTYGGTAGMYFYDRTNLTHNHSIYSNSDILRIGAAPLGLDYASFDASGFMRLSISQTGVYKSILQISRAMSFNWDPGNIGMGLDMGDITNNYTSATALTTAHYASIGQMTLTAAGGTSFTTAASLHIKGAVVASTNVAITNPLSFYVEAGRSVFLDEVNIGSVTDAGAYLLQVTGSSYLNGRVGVKIDPNQTGGSLNIGVSDYNSSIVTGMAMNAGTSNNPITAGSSTLALMSSAFFGVTTRTSTNSSIVHTDDATVLIDGASIASTNTTITNAWALMVKSGKSFFGDEVLVAQRYVPQSGDNGVKIDNSNIIQGMTFTTSWAETTLNLNPSASDVIAAGRIVMGGFKNNGKFVQNGIATGGDANFTVGVNDYFCNLSATLTAGRNFVLPSAEAGRMLVIWNQNSSGNAWTFTSRTVTDGAGTTVTTMTNDKVYTLFDTGTNFVVVSIGP